MRSTDYNLLKKILDFKKSIIWLEQDANDDFFPDPIRYKDIVKYSELFLENRKHRILDHTKHPFIEYFVPKNKYFLRDSIYLPIIPRILYLSILNHILYNIDPCLEKANYSYRIYGCHDTNTYPFSKSTEQWKNFINDFRNAALQDSNCTVVLTDLSCYYSHIKIRTFLDIIGSLIPGGQSVEDQACLSLLSNLLTSWTKNDYGIPVNYDPSSYLCSAFLTPIDREMIRKKYYYFRYVDDIRIVAESEEQAIQAIHDLQIKLKDYGLYLNPAKTKICNSNTADFNNIMDVTDEKIISDFEDALYTKNIKKISKYIPTVFERLEFHSTSDGDDKKFRAYANRLDAAASYNNLENIIWPKLREITLKKIPENPERTDKYVKILSRDVDSEMQITILNYINNSIYDWQIMHLIELLIRCEHPLNKNILDGIEKKAREKNTDIITSKAIMLIGKNNDDIEKMRLFNDYYLPNKSTIIKRAVLIAIQEINSTQRDQIYRKAIEIDPEQIELIEYIKDLKKPQYTTYQKQTKSFPDEYLHLVPISEKGIGLIKGKKVRFALSRSDYSYE